ncbi:lipopolysaccharide biosynthesis protein [Geomonas sp. Red69]|uniref:GumC family protein n=1 Tax=Geomonas diazotrophica TaxID=2843197 RepID=UPI001C11AC09|nr:MULTISPECIES: Wzz/FepE/Etk N-terminal domain-containing protein [Geomonas]MBU5636076.1 lipopolysaccharide biosynthesis protein [Geomonas diazotrophica]QXE85045.1 lipopolysaccharide biosynthesis protein [Geomonas nitrogeniifigens]
MEADKQLEDDEIRVLELLRVVFKRKMLIVKISALTAVAAVCYSLALPNIYSATARVLPPQKEGGGGISALLGQAGGLAGLAAGGLGGGSDLYLGILRSRSVADAIIGSSGLADGFKGKTMELARLQLSTSVKFQSGKDGIITITADDKDPKRATRLANAFVEELGKTTVRLNLSKAGTERAFLEKRLAVVKKDLKAAEESLRAYSQSNKVVQMEAQAKASIEGIAKLRAELASKEVQLAVLTSKQTEQSPEVKAVQSSIRGLKSHIGALTGNGGDGEAIPAVGRVPGVGLEYARRMRDLKAQEAIFEQLTKQYEVAKLNEAKDASSLQVLDEAVVPTQKSRPARTRLVVMITAVGFFASIMLAFLLEYLEHLPESDRKTLHDIRRYAFRFK